MIANILIGIFIGITGKTIYNRYFIPKDKIAMFREVELSCLYLFLATYEDFHYLKQKKEMMMHKMGVSENEIKMTKNVDEQNILSWQKTAINKFLLAVPSRFRPLISYRNWKGAMAYLNTFKKST
mgnify:CR=1 FL=1|tara:strand:+ start:449 stop:823 length:375 start_codon:yes stop_codon:yes gene_type:complete